MHCYSAASEWFGDYDSACCGNSLRLKYKMTKKTKKTNQGHTSLEFEREYSWAEEEVDERKDVKQGEEESDEEFMDRQRKGRNSE